MLLRTAVSSHYANPTVGQGQLNRASVLKSSRPGEFFGWWVVAGCFVMATACWGLAFYGNGIYLAHAVRQQGWPIDQVSPAFTLFYWLGAVLIVATGRSIDRMGPRRSTSIAVVAMASGVVIIAHAQSIVQFYLALPLMALGWSWMSGAAINTILARWFDTQRGTALSIALTGASMGGILVVPLMVLGIDTLGYARGISLVAIGLMVLVLAMAAVSFVRSPGDLGQTVDGADTRAQRATAGHAVAQEAPIQAATADHATEVPVGAGAVIGARKAVEPPAVEPWSIGFLLRQRAFITNVLPFAFGLLAQAGFLTHQVTMLEEQYSRALAAWGVVVTTASAMLGRLVAGYFADRYSRRLIAAVNFAVQVIGILLYAFFSNPLTMFLACAFFGIAVGNMIAFSGLLVQREFPKAQFAHVTRWATALTQATYAVGPALLGAIRQATGSYYACLLLCAAIGLSCSLVVWFGRPRQSAWAEPA